MIKRSLSISRKWFDFMLVEILSIAHVMVHMYNVDDE